MRQGRGTLAGGPLAQERGAGTCRHRECVALISGHLWAQTGAEVGRLDVQAAQLPPEPPKQRNGMQVEQLQSAYLAYRFLIE